MNVVRIIGAVVVGYLLFAVGSMSLVSMTAPGDGAVVAAILLVALVVTGVVAGWVAAKIAGGGRRVAGYVLAGLVALATLANLFLALGAEPVWYKVATLLLTVPAILCMTVRKGG